MASEMHSVGKIASTIMPITMWIYILMIAQPQMFFCESLRELYKEAGRELLHNFLNPQSFVHTSLQISRAYSMF